jgi:hypothetical protein
VTHDTTRETPAPAHGETTWNTGQNARTLIKYDDFRVVLISRNHSTELAIVQDEAFGGWHLRRLRRRRNRPGAGKRHDHTHDPCGHIPADCHSVN